MQRSATFLYNSTAVGQLRNIPGMPIIHIEYSLLKTSFAALCHVLVQLHSRGTAPQHTWAMGIIINHSHILHSAGHFLVQLNSRGTASQHTWTVGILINHSNILHSAVELSCTTPQPWDSSASYLGNGHNNQSFTYSPQCSATFLYSSTAVGQLCNIPGQWA